MLDKLIGLFIPPLDDPIGGVFLHMLAIIAAGCFFIFHSLNFPSKTYIRRNGLKSINFKKLFKEAEFRDKFFTLLGLQGILVGLLRLLSYIVHYIIHWEKYF
ncbi:MAG: hypothetical protein K9N09_08925 [Candidatus Cloacimonetes bacterium]|nr:hypothetical protein [Candidatus Cloacimonadota bacterium]MCF7813965.1 hypothetical protein [Candidatus Cloacimonadota bacterium]MCF7868809.1 hypothetical protein [Candidatus Cloacimonadota bacterium]MCF7884068.1 hypothetical protein [Candidatus Cloacimonadota bacterium]